MGPFGSRFNYPEFFLGFVVGLLLYWLMRRAVSVYALAKAGGKEVSHTLRRYFSSASAEPFKQELAIYLDKHPLNITRLTHTNTGTCITIFFPALWIRTFWLPPTVPHRSLAIDCLNLITPSS